MTPARTDPVPGASEGDSLSALMPDAVDVTWRAAALWTTWMKSRVGITDAVRESADDLRVRKYLTVYEERYLQDALRSPGADAAYGHRMLRVQVLFWAVGLVSGFDVPCTDAHMRAIVEGRSAEDLVYEARLRPLPLIAAEANRREIDRHLSGLGRTYVPKSAEMSVKASVRAPEVIEPCIALAWLLGRFAAGDSPEPQGIR